MAPDTQYYGMLMYYEKVMIRNYAW